MKQKLIGLSPRYVAAGQKHLHPGAWCVITGFKNAIASAQRLVLESAQSVRRFARERVRHPSVVSALSHPPLP